MNDTGKILQMVLLRNAGEFKCGQEGLTQGM